MNISKDKLNIIVTPNSNKLKILDSFNNEKELHNIKFMTKKEFIDNYYYSYDDNTIMYLMKKYNLNIDIIKVYLKYMNIIDINKDYKSNKINYLRYKERIIR